jgi:hypothetical protein
MVDVRHAADFSGFEGILALCAGSWSEAGFPKLKLGYQFSSPLDS